MRPGAPRLAELLCCHLVLVLFMCRPGLPADQQGAKKTLTIGYLAALTVSTLRTVVSVSDDTCTGDVSVWVALET
jgi:hypothetical protein